MFIDRLGEEIIHKNEERKNCNLAKGRCIQKRRTPDSVKGQ